MNRWREGEMNRWEGGKGGGNEQVGGREGRGK